MVKNGFQSKGPSYVFQMLISEVIVTDENSGQRIAESRANALSNSRRIIWIAIFGMSAMIVKAWYTAHLSPVATRNLIKSNFSSKAVILLEEISQT